MIGSVMGSEPACFPFDRSFRVRCVAYNDIIHSQNGTSEELIGEWMELRDIRDQMVVATKVNKT